MITSLICFSILGQSPANGVDGTKAFLNLTTDLMSGKMSLKAAPKAVDAAFKESVHNGWFIYSDPQSPNRLLWQENIMAPMRPRSRHSCDQRLLWQENIMAPMLRLNRMYKKSPSGKSYYRAALLQLLKGSSQLRAPLAELPPADFTSNEWTAGCQIGVIMLIHFPLQLLNGVDHAPSILRLSKLVGPKSERALQYYKDRNYTKLDVLHQQVLADLRQAHPWAPTPKS